MFKVSIQGYFDNTNLPIFVTKHQILNNYAMGNLSPAFSKKSGGTQFSAFRPSVRPSVRPSFRPSVFPSFRPPKVLCTLCAQLLLQFYADSFETLQMFWSWSEDMHVVWILS